MAADDEVYRGGAEVAEGDRDRRASPARPTAARRTEVSVCLTPRGEAAVFVTQPAHERDVLDLARFAAAFAARGLRLIGLSSSARSAAALFPHVRSTVVTSGSVLDAALSLVREPRAAVA
jgi:hypothetical protein